MKKILIAIKGEFTSNNFSEIFLKESFDVTITNSGRGILEIVDHDPPDVILADVNLPDIDIFSVLDKLMEDERTKRIPFIVYSRTGAEEHRDKAMEHEAKDFVVGLSDSPKDIVSRIKMHLGEQAAYIFNIEESNRDVATTLADVVGYNEKLKCPNCGTNISLRLLRNLALGKNTFNVSFVCSKCEFHRGTPLFSL